MLFSLAEGGRVALESADCSAGADANETEPADLRLAGVFILWEEERRCEYEANEGNVWPTGRAMEFVNGGGYYGQRWRQLSGTMSAY